jgi:hypothetical protein
MGSSGFGLRDAITGMRMALDEGLLIPNRTRDEGSERVEGA